MKIIDVVVDNDMNIVVVNFNDNDNIFTLYIAIYKVKAANSCDFSVSYTEYAICIEERFYNSKTIETVYDINDILIMAGMV